MSDHFTLMIIPSRKSGVKKITIPKIFIRNILIGVVVFILVSLYVVYDYASIKRDRAELNRLRAQTKEQSRQLKDLGMKMDMFSDRMEALSKVDKKIRLLAYETSSDKKLPLGIGGSDKDTKIRDLLDKDHEQVVTGMQKNLEKLNAEARDREKSFTELMAFLQNQKSILASTPSLWPVQGWVTSEFGKRKAPFSSGIEFHRGLDISTQHGKAIIAPAEGFVTGTGYEPQDGNFIKINHGHGFETAYLHLSRIAVKQGMRVKKGELIGYVGSTGPHLHYAVSVNGIHVNPRRYLR